MEMVRAFVKVAQYRTLMFREILQVFRVTENTQGSLDSLGHGTLARATLIAKTSEATDVQEEILQKVKSLRVKFVLLRKLEC